MRKKGDEVNGWLIVDKPEGMGSTQVVSLTRRLFNAKKNGHTGTLDPFASGVLPIAFGEATKLIEFISDDKKEYIFTICWGSQTDTGDYEGQITKESQNIPDYNQILSVLPHFIGTITQTPPIYSAIKINGQRAYDLARKGIEVEIPQRKVEVYELELLEVVDEKHSRFRVSCSKGTYVRSLGRDIALALNSCGHLSQLRRTKWGIFDLSDKILLENLKNLVYIEERKQYLLPLETSLRDIAVMAVSASDAAKLQQGQALSPKILTKDYSFGTILAAMSDSQLVAIVRVEESRISPIRVFNL